MNGNRLYRSTSEAAIGGVAAGLGNYFNIDPTIVRIAFVFLTIVSGGGFILVYLAMWLLIPTAGSTATEPGKIVQENLNDIGARLRGVAGGSTGSASNGGNGSAGGNPGTPPNGGNQVQAAQADVATQAKRLGACPMLLILVGALFLLANTGVLRGFHWGVWWPLLLVGLGAIMLSRRR